MFYKKRSLSCQTVGLDFRINLIYRRGNILGWDPKGLYEVYLSRKLFFHTREIKMVAEPLLQVRKNISPFNLYPFRSIIINCERGYISSQDRVPFLPHRTIYFIWFQLFCFFILNSRQLFISTLISGFQFAWISVFFSQFGEKTKFIFQKRLF